MFTKRVFRFHRWVGLAGGICMSAVCLSGAFVALIEPFEALTAGRTVTVTPRPPRLSYDELFARARERVPEFHLYDFARLPQQPGAPLELLYFPDGTYRSVFIDPYTGEVTGYLHNTLSRWLLKFHWSLGLGEQGRPGAGVVFACAILVLMSVASGGIVYRRRLGQALRFRTPVAGRSRMSGLHRLVGTWCGLFVVTLFGTGAYINYHIVTGVYAYPGGATLTRAAVTPLRVSVDACLGRAMEAVPGLVPRSFSFPQLEGGPLAVSGRVLGHDGFLGGSASVSFDSVTGALLSVTDRARHPTRWSQFETALFRLHYADFGGLPLKLAYAGLSVIASLLPVSGYAIALAKRRGRRPGDAGRRTVVRTGGRCDNLPH